MNGIRCFVPSHAVCGRVTTWDPEKGNFVVHKRENPGQGCIVDWPLNLTDNDNGRQRRYARYRWLWSVRVWCWWSYHLCWKDPLKFLALEDTFLRIPGLKRSQSPESVEDNDDPFSFLQHTEENDPSESPRPESPRMHFIAIHC